MNVLDLFSGIGGFSLGLERAGMRTVAFCEIEPFCRAVLKKHWPHVPCYEDVRALTAELLAADGIAVDVICGGFPCQDVSVAGRREGLAGARSGLWFEYARIIGELRPLYVIVENVAGLLNRGLDTVLGDLASLGYDAEWHCIPASAIGAPHRRDRIWIVAHGNGAQQRQQSIGIGGGNGAPVDLPDGAESALADTCSADAKGWLADRGWGWRAQSFISDANAQTMFGIEIAGDEPDGINAITTADADSSGREGGPLEPSLRAAELTLDRCSILEAWQGWNGGFVGFGRVDDGIPAGLGRSSLSSYGNAVVPQIPEIIGRAIMKISAS